MIDVKFKIMENIESSKGEIVMYQPDETIRLEVRMGEDTCGLVLTKWHVCSKETKKQ